MSDDTEKAKECIEQAISDMKNCLYWDALEQIMVAQQHLIAHIHAESVE